MATLYKNKGIWYVSIYHNYKRITRSLNTRDKRTATRLKANTVSKLIADIRNGCNHHSNLDFNQLISKFSTTEHNSSQSIYETCKYYLLNMLKANLFPPIQPAEPSM